LLGSRVKCAQCGATFLVQANPYQDFPPPQSWPPPSAGLASSGPTDRQFRIGAAALLPIIGLGMLAALFAMQDLTMGAVVIIGLGPFAIFYGIAALIDPNIVRAAGKFGTHLPVRYKLIALGVGLAALVCSLGLMYVVWSRLAQG